MAANSPSFSTKILVLMILFTIFSPLHHFLHVSSFEFQVGDNSGWIVPPPNDTKIYNHWASEKRFIVGDTVRFKYRKDSVMEVSEAGYKECNSTHPSFFSNNGNTALKLDRPGFSYFISGANGHCEKGQKMIIRVMSREDSGTKSSAGISSSAAPPVADHHLSLSWTITHCSALFCFLSFLLA